MTIPSPALPGDTPRETKVFAVGALKGGTGKTRIAMLIALILHTVFGYKVVVFDADSGSQTSSRWPVKARQRGYAWDLEIIRHPFETLHDEIDAIVARGDVDYVIVDVGGGNIAAFQSAVRKAHKLYVPLCPDEGDLEQAPQTRTAALMAASLNTVGCAMYYVLSRCDQNSRDKDDSREILLFDHSEFGPYPLTDTDIPDLVHYKRAFGRIPRMKGASAVDPDCPRWDELKGFVPLLIETEVLTKEQVVAAGLMNERQIAEANV